MPLYCVYISIYILKSQSSKSTKQIGIRHLFLSTFTLLGYFGKLEIYVWELCPTLCIIITTKY